MKRPSVTNPYPTPSPNPQPLTPTPYTLNPPQGNTFDVDRLIELLQAFETFVDIRDSDPLGPDPSSTTTLSSGTPPPRWRRAAPVAALWW